MYGTTPVKLFTNAQTRAHILQKVHPNCGPPPMSVFVDHGPGFVQREAWEAVRPLTGLRWQPAAAAGYTVVTFAGSGEVWPACFRLCGVAAQFFPVIN